MSTNTYNRHIVFPFGGYQYASFRRLRAMWPSGGDTQISFIGFLTILSRLGLCSARHLD